MATKEATPTSTSGINTTSSPPAYEANGDGQVSHQSAYNPPQNAQTSTSQLFAQVQPTPLQSLGEYPSVIYCPFCHNITQTRIEQKDSSMTMLAGVLVGLVCICAACLPCMLHWCADVDHFCTTCNQRVCHVPYSGVPQAIHPAPNVPQQYDMQEQTKYDEQQSGVVQSQSSTQGSQPQNGSSSQFLSPQPTSSTPFPPSPASPNIDSTAQRPISELDSTPALVQAVELPGSERNDLFAQDKQGLGSRDTIESNGASRGQMSTSDVKQEGATEQRQN